MTHNNLVHKFVLMPQAMKTPDAKSSSGHGMEWQLDKVKSKKEVILEAKRDKQKSTLLH